jgi:mono/diheme cytochrome c family protein
MADGATVKAYEAQMPGLPEGVVSQPSMSSPKTYTVNFVRGSDAGQALVSSYPADAETLALGGKMYGIYCTPCHGVDGVNLGAVAQPGRLPGVVPLAGPAGVAKNRNDGWIYLTIRNGGAIMPPYGHAMSDREMWSTVAYVRTLDNAKYVPPEAP